MKENIQNPVYFVGAGPGDPELITVRGRRLLDQADVVVFAGSLVNPVLLKGLRAEIHDSSGMDLDRVIQVMSGAQQQGKKVVRLHTGDPSIYGAIREQMKRLNGLGIPYCVVPGVTSAAASAASIKRELTCPGISQTVIFTRRAGRTPVPRGEEIKALSQHQATMCIFLSIAMIEELAEELISGGYPPRTPVAVVEKASWPDEKIIEGTIEDIASRVKAAGIKKTAMIMVGRVLSMEGGRDSNLYHPEFHHGYRKARD
ncbi:MAG: precorrin-4 C(11)-methyltransferase [Thermodesulfatator sp.]|nr:MAG: precorrin-4 C(11)-methyltransferase [Thermodesulfatator sp.]